jgi:TPR repeat protein
VSLAELYEAGRGVALDPDAALLLYRKALDAGHTAAQPAVLRMEAALRAPEYAP